MTPASVTPFTGIQKAAVLLTVLGDQAGFELLRHLSEEEVELVLAEAARLKDISSAQAESVLEEFHQRTAARDSIAKNSGESDLRQLARSLESEHPQTIAIVLSLLDVSQAAMLLQALPEHLQGDAAIRLVTVDQVSAEVTGKIAALIGEKPGVPCGLALAPRGGVSFLTAIVKRLDTKTSGNVMSFIEQQDPSLCEEIRPQPFTFEGIAELDANAINEIFGLTDRRVLTTALKGTGEHIRNHFLACLPEPEAMKFREEIESLGPVRIREVEEAQRQVTDHLGALDHVL